MKDGVEKEWREKNDRKKRNVQKQVNDEIVKVWIEGINKGWIRKNYMYIR